MSFNWKASGLFAAGVAFGTAGIKILSSKDAKHAYTQCTAAALRAKDCVMKTVKTVILFRRMLRIFLLRLRASTRSARLRLRLLRFRMHLRMYASVLRLMSRKQSRLRLQQRLLRHRR